MVKLLDQVVRTAGMLADSPFSHERVLASLDRGIVFRANSANILDKILANYRMPNAAVVGESDLRVALVSDDALLSSFQALLRPMVVDAVLRTCICTSESGTYRVERVVLSAGWTAFRCVRSRCILLGQAENRQYYFLLPADYAAIGKLGADVEPMLEHLVVRDALQQGASLIHASVVAHKGRGIAFVGPKRSGKTTCFFDACLSHQATPVAVDKILLRLEESGRFRAHHVASSLRALSGTLRKYPAFSSYIPVEFRDATEAQHWAGLSSAKARVPLADFEELARARFAPSVELTDVVFPNIRAEGRGRLEPISADEALGLLAAQDFSSAHPEEDEWSGLPAIPADVAMARLAGVCRSVRLWRLDAGSDSAEVMRPLLAEDEVGANVSA